MIDVTLYSRADCHLCEQALDDLGKLQEVIPHHLEVVDVDSDPELNRTFGSKLPVVEAGPYRIKAPFNRQDLRMILSAAVEIGQNAGGMEKPETFLKDKPKEVWSKSDDLTTWFANHYLAVFNFMVLIYVGLPFLAPVLMNAGIERPAKLIYSAYGLLCHQLAYRSIFLFGEQPVYPRAAAGIDDMLTFSQATGQGEGNTAREIFAARSFVGNDLIGYKVALCQRDLAIYGAILLFGLLYALTGRKLPGLPWYLWILFGLVPIGLDGLSQLLSQPPLNFWPYRESTPLLRIATGALFGFTTAWFGYPLVEETMVETRQMMARKFKRTHGLQVKA